MLAKRHAAAALVLLASTALAHAQSLQTLTNQSPEILIYGFVMTDGTVLAQGQPGPNGGSLNHWFTLTPDNTGSYLNGTWSQVANAPYAPYAGGGAVLADGRLALIGGEYTSNNFTFTLTRKSAVYSPYTNSWVMPVPPKAFQPGLGGFTNFGNSPTMVLPGGLLLIGQKTTKRDVALDPRNLTWIQFDDLQAEKRDFNAEEGWTLLPDGSILTLDVLAAPHTERLVPAARAAGYHWISDGVTPSVLASPRDACCIPYNDGRRIYNPAGEIGPAILRPDGTVFATGSLAYGATAGHTAIYHPGPTTTDPGIWTAGPDFQTGDNAGDSFGVLETSGNVLVEGDKFHFAESATMPIMMAKRTAANAPQSSLYEFDGTHFAPLPVSVDPGSSLLPLPSGQVLVMGLTEKLLNTTGTYQQAWAPTVTSAPASVTGGSTYRIFGTQFNGLSQACAYGDEFQCATNYPLVRITNAASGHVIYARTHDHSTMGVATGAKIVSTFFDVPAGIETGASSLVVVANGIPSMPVSVTVQ